jgi:hypothetical protein
MFLLPVLKSYLCAELQFSWCVADVFVASPADELPIVVPGFPMIIAL